jgi:hypothetical protein
MAPSLSPFRADRAPRIFSGIIRPQYARSAHARARPRLSYALHYGQSERRELTQRRGPSSSFLRGLDNGSIDSADLVAEDIVNHQPEAEPEQGRQRFEEAVKGVMRAVPDSQWTVSDLLADGDRVAARTTWSGTYQAPEFRG